MNELNMTGIIEDIRTASIEDIRIESNIRQSNNVKRNRPSKSWWDKECEEIIKNRKKWLKLFKRNKDMHSFVEFKKARAIARKIINKKKRDNFMNYCKSINRFSNLKHVWNAMRIFKNSRISIDWNKWQLENRNEVILESIEELAPLEPRIVRSTLKKIIQIIENI